MRSRQYTDDVLAPPSRKPVPPPLVAAESGLVVEDSAGDFCGAVVGCEKDAVTLEDRHGKRRVFPLPGTFLLEGKRVTLVRPVPERAGARPGPRPAPLRRRSRRARVARASRIYVEGKHDAELVERVWGDDLREVGVVVEFLNGIDDLPAIAAEFGAGGDRRLGVLVDHLVDGSKESRIAAQVTPSTYSSSATPTSISGPRLSPRGRHQPLAGRAARSAVERGRARGHRLAIRYRRPPGGAFSAGCAPSPTLSPPSLAGSRS